MRKFTSEMVNDYADKLLIGLTEEENKMVLDDFSIIDSDIDKINNIKGIENVEIAKQPLYTTKANLERSGMGFTIMESFMDDVQVESVLGLGTKVTMRKTIKSSNKKEEFAFSVIGENTETREEATIRGDE